MHNWFECKVRYEKTLENGLIKKVTEIYLVDALSFTEAEARITKNMQPYITGEFTVTAIKRANYSDLFDTQGGDKYYNCKVGFVTIDEKSAKEKRTYTHILVTADNINEAEKHLVEGMKGTLSDYETYTIDETKIMDIFPFDASSDDETTMNVEKK